ncbi:hypothetical protein [Enterovirga rhinocerotis]|nr:hypothetical protein [Enterovirga rhinocerotis]
MSSETDMVEREGRGLITSKQATYERFFLEASSLRGRLARGVWDEDPEFSIIMIEQFSCWQPWSLLRTRCLRLLEGLPRELVHAALNPDADDAEGEEGMFKPERRGEKAPMISISLEDDGQFYLLVRGPLKELSDVSQYAAWVFERRGIDCNPM